MTKKQKHASPVTVSGVSCRVQGVQQPAHALSEQSGPVHASKQAHVWSRRHAPFLLHRLGQCPFTATSMHRDRVAPKTTPAAHTHTRGSPQKDNTQTTTTA
jgi:hypothetical protein